MTAVNFTGDKIIIMDDNAKKGDPCLVIKQAQLWDFIKTLVIAEDNALESFDAPGEFGIVEEV